MNFDFVKSIKNGETHKEAPVCGDGIAEYNTDDGVIEYWAVEAGQAADFVQWLKDGENMDESRHQISGSYPYFYRENVTA